MDTPGETVAAKLPPGSDGEHYGARVGLMFGALFVIYGVHVPYLAVWLDTRGLSPAAIGVITAAPAFLRLAFSPAVCLAADRHAAHRQAIQMLAAAALAMALVLPNLHGFWPIFLAAVGFHLAVTTIMPLIETIAVAGVRRRGLDYGRMRLWGSLTFIVSTTAGGALVGAHGGSAGVWLMAAGAVLTLAVSFLLPRSGGAPAAGAKPASSLADARRLASHPLFLLFLAAVGAVQGAHAMFYTFGALAWSSQGISGLGIGVLWAIGVLAEVALFAWSAAVLNRAGVMTLLIAGCAAAVVRWTLMASAPPFAALVVMQLLHALTYGATHIAAIHFIGRAVPDGAAGTAQSLYATVAAGLSIGGATLAAGHLYASHGALAYLAMAAMSALGLLFAVVLARRWRGGLLWTEESAAPRSAP